MFTHEVERMERAFYSSDLDQGARELAYDYLHLAARWLQYAEEIQE